MTKWAVVSCVFCKLAVNALDVLALERAGWARVQVTKAPCSVVIGLRWACPKCLAAPGIENRCER